MTADQLRGLAFRSDRPAPPSAAASPTWRSSNRRPRRSMSPARAGACGKRPMPARAFEPLFERERVHSIGAVAVFQPNPEIVWAGTGEARQRTRAPRGATASTNRPTAAAHGITSGLRDSRHIAPHRAPPDQPRHRLRRRARSPVGTESRARSLQVGRRRQDVAQRAVRRQRHRRRRCGDRSVGSEGDVRRGVSAAPARVGLPRRRPGQRPLQVDRRRRLRGRRSRAGLPSSDKGRIGIAVSRTDPAHRLRVDRAGRPLRHRRRVRGAQGRRLSLGRQGRDVDAHERLESAADVRQPDSRRPQRRRRASTWPATFSYSSDRGKTFTAPPDVQRAIACCGSIRAISAHLHRRRRSRRQRVVGSRRHLARARRPAGEPRQSPQRRHAPRRFACTPRSTTTAAGRGRARRPTPRPGATNLEPHRRRR